MIATRTLRRRPRILATSSLAMFASLLLVILTAQLQHTPMPVPGGSTALDLAARLRELPFAFVPNVGQAAPDVAFLAQQQPHTIAFTPAEIVLSLPGAAEPAVARIRFAGANPEPRITGADRQSGTVNYYHGNDPSRWHAGVPTYSGVTYEQLYPGIDLHYDGTSARLKGTYYVAPGADPRRIRWRYPDAVGLQVAPATGELLVAFPGAARLTETAPIAWQTIDGQQIPVAASYSLAADGSVGFTLGAYDPRLQLVIDPTIVFGTLLGGGNVDEVDAIAVDSAGNAYVTGTTASANFSDNPVRQRRGGEDIFVVKLDPVGGRLVYATYLGGGQDGPDPEDRGDEDEGSNAIAVDQNGSVYLTGATDAIDFPTTAGVLQPAKTGMAYSDDAYVTKLAADGTLSYSTYLGGQLPDEGEGIAVDATGHAYVTGFTSSDNFPTAGALQPTFGGDGDAFVVKLNPTGSALVYGTYLGGSGVEIGADLALENGGNVVVVGTTASDNFPTRNPVQGGNNGNSDLFIARLNAAGSTLLHATYLGGRQNETAEGVAVDSSGNAYVTGITLSNNFPTAGPLQPTFAGCNSTAGPCGDAFVSKLAPGGNSLVYSTFLGGSDREDAFDIAVTGAGEAVIAGATLSVDFPTRDALQSYAGAGDAFVTRLNAAGSALGYSTFLGGSASDVANTVAIGSTGDIYVAGYTLSSNFPLVQPLQATNRGLTDGFVVRLSNGDSPVPPTPPPGVQPTPPPGGPPTVSSVTIGDRDALTARAATLRIAATGDAPISTMYVREWQLVTTEGLPRWEVVRSSGWVPFQTDYAWELGTAAGTHVVGVWVRDEAGRSSRLSRAALDTVSLLVSDTNVDAGRAGIYQVYYQAGTEVNATLEVMRGDADLFVWYPGSFPLPEQVSLGGGTATETIRFTTPRAGTYLFVVFGFEPSTYTLRLTPGGGRPATAARDEPVTLAQAPGTGSATPAQKGAPDLLALLGGAGLDPLDSISATAPVSTVYLPMIRDGCRLILCL